MTPTRPDRWAPWRNVRWMFTAIWMLFLAYPIGAVATSGQSTPLKLVGYTVIAVFAACYLLTAVYVLTRPPAPNRRGLVVFVVLTALSMALLPIIGENAFGTAPFLMAIAAFTFSLAWATITVGAVIVAAVVVPNIFGWDDYWGLAAILVAVGFTMLGVRTMAVREAERTRAEQRQRELNAELAVVAERELIARDVHDILGHSLTVISVKTELATKLVDRDPERAKAELTEINQLTRAALAEVRSTVGQWRTPNLTDTLAAAESALRAAEITATLPRSPVATEDDTLFAWALREAVTNVVRHSNASRCQITLDSTELTVCDNGSGVSTTAGQAAPSGTGLRGLGERVEQAGGIMEFSSGPTGTTLRVSLP